jgi:hypothetical protein
MPFLSVMVQVLSWMFFAASLVVIRTATREARQRVSQLKLQSNMILSGIFAPALVVSLLRHTVPGRIAAAVTILMAMRMLWVSWGAWKLNKAAESERGADGRA